MHTFASVTDFRFLNKVVLEQIEIANAIISKQNGHIYAVCFQTGIVQEDLSGRPSESFQNFQWSPPFGLSVTTDPPLCSPKVIFWGKIAKSENSLKIPKLKIP